MRVINAPSLHLAVATTDILSPATRSILSASEKQKSEHVSAPGRSEEYASGRILLRKLLETVTGLPASSHRIRTTDSGKPECEGGPGISISHSRGVIACAVAIDDDVGVDIEFPDPRRDTARLAKRYFSTAEFEWLATQPEDRFYMLWVLKEAWLKAVGTGIAGGLDRMKCQVAPPVIDIQLDGSERCELGLFAMSDAFLALATIGGGNHDTAILEWDTKTGKLVAAQKLDEIARGAHDGKVAGNTR